MIYDYDLIIIGGGSAGLSLASESSQLGVKTLLVDQQKLGGDSLLSGSVPRLSLLRSAKITHHIRHANSYGLQAMRPTFEWSHITERIASIRETMQNQNHPRHFRDLGCDVVFASASFVDEYHVQLVFNDEMRSYQPVGFDSSMKPMKVAGKKIVLATGSRPDILSISGLQESGFLADEQLFTLSTQPASLAVIGGSVTGIEIAQAFARLGTQVTLVVSETRILHEEDMIISEIIEKRLEEDGVKVMKGVTVQEVSVPPTGGKQVVYGEAGVAHTLNVDDVFVATGRVPNIESLNLDAAGIKYDAQGIVVDKKMRTNKKRILAIGDVNGQSPFPHGANYEAGIVLSNEILHLSATADYDEIGWTVFTDPEIASIGYNEKRAQEAGVKHEIVEFSFESHGRALAESETDGLIRIVVGKGKRILGCQIIAPRAGEMIREWQLLMREGIPLSKIARSAYIYPTYGEVSKWVAEKYFAPKRFSNSVRSILRTLFGYRGKK